MNIRIQVLNVGDADSIIVTLIKNSKTFVMLIDGARAKDFQKIKNALDKQLFEHNKIAPDLIVCTHYDDDHIGGLIKLFEPYSDARTLWSFDIKQINNLLNQDTISREHMLPSEEDASIGAIFTNERQEKAYETLLTTARQEKELIQMALKRDVAPVIPFADEVDVPGWEEIKVIGPTKEYYNELYGREYDNEALRADIELMTTDLESKTNFKNSCEALNLSTSPITRVNLISCIILITINEKKYLFTGDAGIQSFEAIPNYRQVLENTYWLKVPHHGSKLNINRSLLEVISPQVAFISGKKIVSDDLVSCMENLGTMVYITRDHNDLLLADGVVTTS